MSCPNVRCGSTWDRRPLSRSKPRRHSSSITALSSQRPPPRGRTRSAGAASSGPPRPATASPPGCSCRTPAPPAPAAPPGPAPASASAPPTAAAPSRSATERQPRTRPRPARCARAFLLALLPVEGVLQLRGRVQRHRAILQACTHAFDVRAEPHRLDAPPRCGVAVTQFAHRVIEQTGEAKAQIQAAPTCGRDSAAHFQRLDVSGRCYCRECRRRRAAGFLLCGPRRPRRSRSRGGGRRRWKRRSSRRRRARYQRIGSAPRRPGMAAVRVERFGDGSVS